MGFPRGPGLDDPDIAAFAGALRTTVFRGPDPAQTAAIVPRLAAAARAGVAETAPTIEMRRPRRRLVVAARIVVAVALLPLLAAGMAVAGVRLPDAANSAFESVGVDLPHQGQADKESSPSATGDADQLNPSLGEGAKQGGAAPHGGAPDEVGGGGQGAATKPGFAGNGQGGPPAHSNAGGNGGGSSNAHGANPNAHGGNPNAGGANRPATPPGQANKPASPGNSGSAGSQGNGKQK